MSRQTRSSATETGAALSPLPSSGAATARPVHWLLAVLITIYVGAAGFHAALVPVGQTGYQDAPDEAAHVNYVRILATGRLPNQQDAARDPQQRSYEWHQPPLYYALATTCLWAGPRGLRIVSVLCGIVAICLIYLCALRLFPAEPDIAVLAAGIAALTPGHIAITSVVGNDALLEVCCTGAMFALIMALRNGFSLWRAGCLGLAIGAAMLTKVTGILLLPILALGLLLLKLGGESHSELARGLAWCLFVATTVCGWWYVRNAFIFHELIPIKTFEANFSGTKQAIDVVHRVGSWNEYWRTSLLMSFMSFWAVYGTPVLARQGIPGFLPDPIYQIMGIVTLCVCAGMIRLHLQRRELTTVQHRAIWIMFALTALVGLAFVSFLSRYYQTQGRYLYPAMVAICIVMALGWRMLFPPRYRSMAAGLLLTVMAAFTVIFLLAVQAANSGS